MRACAVVLGGYVNGYSIIRELYDDGIRDIVLIQYRKQLAGYSNKVSRVYNFDRTAASLENVLHQIHQSYDYLVLFPTDDLQIEFLKEIERKICNFCFLPFNSENIEQSSNKMYQYECCRQAGIPYPKTFLLEKNTDIQRFRELTFPVLLKPCTRKDLIGKVFRSLRLESSEDLQKCEKKLVSYLEQGVAFIASEIIPGSTNGTIFAYTAYRDKSGKILNFWTGKKLSQHPDDYGVFASASNEAPEIIKELGEKLLHHMNAYGIAEPEFKYDYRDGQYKLMEVNLRSMMWHRVGNLSGVHLQYTQYLDALGQPVPTMFQEKNKVVHYIYMLHESSNLLRRKRYWRQFFQNVFGGDECYFAVLNLGDLRPFLFHVSCIVKKVLNICLK